MDPVVKEKFRNLAKALKIQGIEYQRRLHELNGEAERLRNIQATYIPREVFERTVGDLEKRIITLEAEKLKKEGKMQLFLIVPAILTIIGLVLMYLNYVKVK